MLAIESAKQCRWSWLLVDGKKNRKDCGERDHVLVMANIGVDFELHVGIAGTGIPQMNIF